MDVCRFINSRDIRDYLRSIHYQFTPLEAAWLIYYCRELTLKEKHAAWQELIDTMPDVPIEERPWVEARPSLHDFLREYMRYQKERMDELPGRGEEVYTGKEYEKTIFDGAFFHFPLPFLQGDVVWLPHVAECKYDGGPFVFVSAGLDVYRDKETKDRIFRIGDYTDMCARGYAVVFDEKNAPARIILRDYSSYMDLEYYHGEFTGRDERLLYALSDCLKAHENEPAFWETLAEAERKDLLAALVPSGAMRDHLLNAKLHKAQVLAMILGAPVPLTIKQEWLLKLSEKEPAVFRDALLLDQLEEKTDDDLREFIVNRYGKSFTAALADVEEALEQLKLQEGELLYLKECWYDDELKGEIARGTAPFLSLSKALEYVRHDLRECDYKPGDTIWYVLEKWSPGNGGEMEHRYTYYLVGDEIFWFEKMQRDKHDRCYWLPESYDYSSASRNLDLPVPFEVGNIVLVDCTPFRPIKAAVIIEAGEGVMLQALVQNEDGKWRTGAVRNTSLFNDYPLVSALYRMDRYDGELEGYAGLLSEVQDALSENPERGAALWNEINGNRQSSGDLTADEIRKMLEEIKENL